MTTMTSGCAHARTPHLLPNQPGMPIRALQCLMIYTNLIECTRELHSNSLSNQLFTLRPKWPDKKERVNEQIARRNGVIISTIAKLHNLSQCIFKCDQVDCVCSLKLIKVIANGKNVKLKTSDETLKSCASTMSALECLKHWLISGIAKKTHRPISLTVSREYMVEELCAARTMPTKWELCVIRATLSPNC